MSIIPQKTFENLANNQHFLETVLDLAVKGLMVVNSQGIIVYVNRSFEEIHNIKTEDALGKNVQEIIENTRMHIVAKTGMAERDEIQIINGHKYVVSRIPIIEDEICLGAIGIIRFEYTKELNRLNEKNEKLKQELIKSKKISKKCTCTSFIFDDIVAVSKISSKIKQTALKASATEYTVLLLGESGVGKEVFAHSIHNASKRRNGPFIRINCSAIQETLFESELFGYEAGAFTGASKKGKKGKFELANNGTIFLDEIGDMPLNVQSRLLRVLQEKEIDKIGSEEVIKVDVRLISATNKNLRELVKKGRFRQDLFYRINVIPIELPPLRERKEDIPELINLFWKELQAQQGVYHKTLSADALKILEAHDWPGNIRELHNVLERIMALVQANEITKDNILTLIRGNNKLTKLKTKKENANLADKVQSTEKKAITEALILANNNRSHAAKILGISRAFLYKKLHQYNMLE